jgi:protein-S-isoprenylcysteine O-methyltransferase Ste14
MKHGIRLFVLIEGTAFIAAALTHFGTLVDGYEHRKAGTAESIIGIVLLTGWVMTWIRPPWIRGVGLAVQAFALLGTLVGIFTIAVGVGPRTVPDLIYHACIVVVLVSGLILTWRARNQGGALSRRRSESPG